MSTDQIRALNDAFRATSTSDVYFTRSVSQLGCEAQRQILVCVRAFTAFTKDNDPNGGHDFGAVDYGEHKIFWKIDYYDLQLNFGSDDPADPYRTRRIMTIMLASDY